MNKERQKELLKQMKYITILDFEDGKVYQYEIEDKFIDNGDYEEYLTNEGHNLNNCEWMVHDIKEFVDTTIRSVL